MGLQQETNPLPNQPCNVYNFKKSWDLALRLVNLAEPVEALIWYIDSSLQEEATHWMHMSISTSCKMLGIQRLPVRNFGASANLLRSVLQVQWLRHCCFINERLCSPSQDLMVHANITAIAPCPLSPQITPLHCKSTPCRPQKHFPLWLRHQAAVREKKRTWLGSMVQNGKFSAGMPILVRTLNSVLLPTFGSPTMPICIRKAKVDA